MHLITRVLSHLEPTFGLQAFEGRYCDFGILVLGGDINGDDAVRI